MSNRISHQGIIESITDDCIKVRIVQTSACAACKVANHCNAAESKVKIVDVFCSNSNAYEVGQQVVVVVSKDVANRALLLGFGVPFLLLLCVLLIVLKLTGNEGVAALASIASLVPYYFTLWLIRDKIQKRISFNL